MPRNRLRKAIGVLLAAAFVGHGIHAYRVPLLETLDASIYDARLNLSARAGIDDRIVILDIDEASLAEVGRWPWNRQVMAQLVQRLFDQYRVRLLAFDVVFAEADNSSGWATLSALAGRELQADLAYQDVLPKLKKQLDFDGQFAAALQNRPVVLGYYFSNRAGARRTGALPAPAIAADEVKTPTELTHWSGYGANRKEFQTGTTGAGHFTPLVDFDGLSRRIPLLVNHEGQYYEALSLAVMRELLGRPAISLEYPDGASLESIKLTTQQGVLRIPVDSHAAALVPYRGRQGSFAYLSAADVLQGRTPVEQLANKIVLVGTTAPGLMDLRATPMGGAYPGVEIHANMIAGIMDNTVQHQPSYSTGLDFLQLLIVSAAFIWLLPCLTPLAASLSAVGLVAGTTLLNTYLWQQGLSLPLATALVLQIVLYAYHMSWGFFTETRTRRQFAELFGQYVPPELVDQMAQDPEQYTMEGRNEELTVLFSDVRGFTTISEGLDPKELAALMNTYLDAMTQVVQRHKGTLDKYIGDAIMAFWGAPVADNQHAKNALMAALEMQSTLRSLDSTFQARGWPLLQIGIGLNTGMMTVGDMGSRIRKSYTVMGDAVNLGSRLESITKQYGVGILVSETTARAVPDIEYRELDRVRVKGKDTPVTLYEPLGPLYTLREPLRAELAEWHAALSFYRRQLWDDATYILKQLSKAHPDRKLYTLYLERIAHYRNQPPGTAWDGVTTFETK